MNMKKLYLILFILVPFLCIAQKKPSRYVNWFEMKSSMSPVYRFSQRTFKYAFDEISVPLTSKKINLVLDNTRQNASFDLISRAYGRVYFVNASYSMGAGLFDKHILTKLLALKDGDISGIFQKTSVNHSFEAGINYLGIVQLFKKVPRSDYHFNASINGVVQIDFSDRFDMSEYINLFEYQNLPEFVLRNKKAFEEVQDFILDKYSIPNYPLYKGISGNIEFGYRRFSMLAQYSFLENKLNSKVNTFYMGAKLNF
jgi:hypothetical protein